MENKNEQKEKGMGNKKEELKNNTSRYSNKKKRNKKNKIFDVYRLGQLT